MTKGEKKAWIKECFLTEECIKHMFKGRGGSPAHNLQPCFYSELLFSSIMSQQKHGFLSLWISMLTPDGLKMSQESEGGGEGGWEVSQMTRAVEDEVATKLQAGYRLGGLSKSHL